MSMAVFDAMPAGSRRSAPGLLLLQSTSPEAMAESREAATPGIDAWAAMLEVSALRGDDEGALAGVAETLCRALGATACLVTLERPGAALAVLEPRALGSEVTRELGHRGELALRSHRIVVGRAVGGEAGVEHTLAARIVDERGRYQGLLCASVPGMPSDGSPAQLMLEVLGRRLGVELGWRALQQRTAQELDAVRQAGGLDPRIGIWTRITLDRLLAMTVAACRRCNEPLSVGVVDVMGMRALNEQHGHAVGDAVLHHVAEVTKYVVRGYDLVGRVGGDAIAVVFDRCGIDQAAEALRRIKRTIAAEPFEIEGAGPLKLAVSGGVAAVAADDANGQRTLARAAAAADGASGGVELARTSQGVPSSRRLQEGGLEGATLGGVYRVLHQLGHGGGGGVYRGEDLVLRRQVAIKVLHPNLADDAKFLQRFREEAATLAAIRHPSLVQIYAFGVEEGVAYFVMELVEGASVAHAILQAIRDGARMPIERVAGIVRQVASALDTLHEAGIIHRDVKPENVLLDPFRSRVVLVDVGIARREGGDEFLGGTPGYVAPEAVSDPNVGRTADVYGLAVTTYEMLLSRIPWPGCQDAGELLTLQAACPPEVPSDVDPRMAPFDDVLLRGMALDPRERWPSTGAFAEAFEAALRRFGSVRIGTSHAPVSSVQLAPTVRPPPVELDPASGRTDDAIDAHTRGIVFRTLPRIVGVREVTRWRMQLAARAPHLGEVLSPSVPALGWLPTRHLCELLAAAPAGTRKPADLGRELGRAVVRASFRRFFPTSAATLAPAGTMAALPRIWRHYHSWGMVEIASRGSDAATVRIAQTPRDESLCACVAGMLEQLVLLSGGREQVVEHTSCESRGGDLCHFEVRWQWAPPRS
jgi:diguanylate cyclase (GGDEF)-like protein